MDHQEPELPQEPPSQEPPSQEPPSQEPAAQGQPELGQLSETESVSREPQVAQAAMSQAEMNQSGQNQPPQGLWESAQHEFRSLYRSTQHRLLGGVAGGLADRYGVPASLVRLGFVLAALTSIGFVVYVVLWLAVPSEDGKRVLGHGGVRDVLVVSLVGLLLFMTLGGDTQWELIRLGKRLAPFALILGGLLLLLSRSERGRPASGVGGPPTGQGEGQPGVGPDSEPRQPNQQTHTQSLWTPRAPRPPRPPRPRPFLGPLTLLVAFLLTLLFSILRVTGTAKIGPGALAAVILGIFAAGLVVSAWRGRARGLLLVAVPLGMLLSALPVLDIRLHSDLARAAVRIETQQELEELDDIEVLAGTGQWGMDTYEGGGLYDFSKLVLTEDHTVSIDQNLGEVHLRLPASTRVRILADGGLDSISIQQPDLSNLVSNFPQLTGLVGTAQFPVSGADATRSQVEKLLQRVGDATTLDGFPSQGGTDLPWSEVQGLTERLRNTGRVELGGEGVGGPVLTINLRIGLGSGYIYYPVWAGNPPPVIDPTQVCVEAGGPVGVMKACNEIAEAQRVAVCFPNDLSQYPDGYVMDCREAGFTSSNEPVCWNRIGKYELCSVLEIEASGGVVKEPPPPTSAPDPNLGYPPEGGLGTVPPLIPPASEVTFPPDPAAFSTPVTPPAPAAPPALSAPAA